MTLERIAILVDKCAPFYVGGYENRYWNIAKQLAPRFDVRVYTSLSEKTAQINHVRFNRLVPDALSLGNRFSRNPAHSLCFGLALSRSPFNDWRPDTVIVEAIPYLQLPLMRKWIGGSHFLRVLNVCEAWGSYVSEVASLEHIARPLLRRSLIDGLSWADRVIAISSVTAESLRVNYGLNSVDVVPMGIDIRAIENQPQSTSGRVYDFAYLGRLVDVKRPVDFIRALAVLKDRYSWRGRAFIAGAGPLQSEVDAEVVRAGLTNQVDRLGEIEETQKIRLLKESLSFVLTSSREGFSLATLEAMACGATPVVGRPNAPEVFGVSELVENKVSGLWFDVGNVDQMATVMNSVIQDRAETARLAAVAREKCGQYDWPKVVSRLTDLLSNSTRGG